MVSFSEDSHTDLPRIWFSLLFLFSFGTQTLLCPHNPVFAEISKSGMKYIEKHRPVFLGASSNFESTEEPGVGVRGAHVYNHGTLEQKAGRSQVQSHLQKM